MLLKALKKSSLCIVHAIKYFLKILLNFVYPPYCVLCDSWLDDDSSIICRDCWSRLANQRLLLHISLSNYQAIGHKIFFDKVISVWDFNPEVQNIIHLFKYQGMHSLAEQLGGMMARALAYDEEYQTADLIIPVPLNRARKRERGYNQSNLLGKRISEVSGIQMENKLLRRVKDTKTQTKLNTKQRSRNVSNAFRVKNSEAISRKSIILVDDVITTGSTLNACAKELKAAGAEKVFVLTIVKA